MPTCFGSACFREAESRQRGSAFRRCAPSVLTAVRFVGLSLALLVINAGATMAAEQGARPPAHYRIEDVTVRVLYQPGMRKVPLQRVTLPGSGDATLERDGAVSPFRYPAKQLMGVLDALYRIHFFEMPASYTAQRSVVLRDDGTVSVQVRQMKDAPSTSLCVTIGAFEKCVTYAAAAPAELKAVERSIFAEATRLAAAGATGK